uniref:ATP synthase F0 subunit 8 n=1 Tax=Loxilobus prominenoculus TaxID=2793212 RepID=A0A7T0ND14_9ORTH|nr:ATP synthase F0 subunit 8 [Loxilobus prominenoculus]
MPQMSNLLWLPLFMYFSIIMMMIFSMLFTNSLTNNKYSFKKLKSNNNNWQW